MRKRHKTGNMREIGGDEMCRREEKTMLQSDNIKIGTVCQKEWNLEDREPKEGRGL